MYDIYAQFTHGSISDQRLLCAEIWVEAVIAEGTADGNSNWMSVLASFSIWVTSIFWLTLITGNRGLFAPKSGENLATRHMRCLKLVDHPTVPFNWPVESWGGFFRGDILALGYDAFSLYEKKQHNKVISGKVTNFLMTTSHIACHFYLWSKTAMLGVKKVLKSWSGEARLYRTQLQVIKTLHTEFGWMTSWCFLTVVALCFGRCSIQVISEKSGSREGQSVVLAWKHGHMELIQNIFYWLN